MNLSTFSLGDYCGNHIRHRDNSHEVNGFFPVITASE